MKFIDTHVHLQDYKARFATDIIRGALAAGVDKMVCAAVLQQDWDKVSRFYKQFPANIVPAFGLHPWYVGEAKADWRVRLEEFLIRFPNGLVGECGLDRLKNPDDEPQNSIFRQHIEIAREYQRPLIVHAVKSQDWLENYWHLMPEKFVFHSYNGKLEMLKKIISRGGYVSFSAGILRGSGKEEVIKFVPIERLLLESDGPYQSLNPQIEGEPRFLPELAAEICRIRGEEPEEFAACVYQNSLEFINVGK